MVSSGHKEFLRWAAEQGWLIEHVSGGHLRMTHPQVKGKIYASCSPSENRGILRRKQQLIQALETGTRVHRFAGVPTEDLQRIAPKRGPKQSTNRNNRRSSTK